MFSPKRRISVDSKDLDEITAALREQNRWFCSSARTLLFLLRTWTHDTTDLDTDAFKKRIDKLVGLLEQEENARAWNRALEAENQFLLGHIDREKQYLQARESELKDVIDFMHKSLLDMIGEASDFTGSMHERSLRIEQTAGLDDIRKIKDTLKIEMSEMRQAIVEKEQNDARRLESLSRQVGSLKSDLEMAKQASVTDRLTGASNRLYFDSYIANSLERYVLSGARFSLLMCDLDDFKKINDSFGHKEGDSVLKTFVSECRALIRIEDVLARYGGEEFAIVLSGVSLRKAIRRAQKICSRIASSRYLVESQGTSRLLTFTTSIGVAEVRPDDTVDTLLDRADRALYMAKRTGKNRAVGENSLSGDESARKAA